MAGNKKVWMMVPPKRKKHQPPDSIKITLKEKADAVIENTLKPERIKPPPDDNDLNYLVDIYSKWYRNYFYFCAKYNSPSPYAISPSFESKFARMEYVGDEKFNLSYMRHTQKWREIYQELSIDESIKIIMEEPHFIP